MFSIRVNVGLGLSFRLGVKVRDSVLSIVRLVLGSWHWDYVYD